MSRYGPRVALATVALSALVAASVLTAGRAALQDLSSPATPDPVDVVPDPPVEIVPEAVPEGFRVVEGLLVPDGETEVATGTIERDEEPDGDDEVLVVVGPTPEQLAAAAAAPTPTRSGGVLIVQVDSPAPPGGPVVIPVSPSPPRPPTASPPPSPTPAPTVVPAPEREPRRPGRRPATPPGHMKPKPQPSPDWVVATEEPERPGKRKGHEKARGEGHAKARGKGHDHPPAPSAVDHAPQRATPAQPGKGKGKGKGAAKTVPAVPSSQPVRAGPPDGLPEPAVTVEVRNGKSKKKRR